MCNGQNGNGDRGSVETGGELAKMALRATIKVAKAIGLK